MAAARLAALLLLALGAPSLHAQPAPPAVPAEASTQGPLEAAQAALERGDYDKAAAGFEALRRAQPRAPAPIIGLAEIAARRGNPALAENQLRVAIAANPRSADLQRALGRMLASQGRLEATRLAFDAAIRLEPDRAGTYLELADLLRARFGEPGLALEYYQRAVVRDRDNGAVHFGTGLALAQIGARHGAVDELAVAAQLLPEDPEPDFQRGQVLVSLRDQDEALRAFDAALVRAPLHLPSLVARGTLLLALRRPAEAQVNFATAMETAPKDPAPLFGMAKVQEALGEIDAAERSFRAALALEPENPRTANDLAGLLAGAKRKLDEALQLAERAVAKAPGDANFLTTLGWVQLQRGELPAAEATLLRALAIRPSAERWTRLAEVRAARGNAAEAGAALQRALALNPNYAPAREALRKLR